MEGAKHTGSAIRIAVVNLNRFAGVNFSRFMDTLLLLDGLSSVLHSTRLLSGAFTLDEFALRAFCSR